MEFPTAKVWKTIQYICEQRKRLYLPILLSILTFLSTLTGGLFAMRFRDKLALIVAFSAGAVIGVVFFDLLPEAISLGEKQYGIPLVCAVIVGGFLFYMVLDRLSILHSHEHTGHNETRGRLGAGSLSIHSFLDGVSMGIAFQVSPAIGLLIAVAVISHDFADGVNTVSVILKAGGKSKSAYLWLFADAVAPVLGVISTLFFKIPESLFGMLLAVFSGFFLYIGASDLLPESRQNNPGFVTALLTIAGIAVLYLATFLAKG